MCATVVKQDGCHCHVSSSKTDSDKTKYETSTKPDILSNELLHVYISLLTEQLGER